jgi:integrase
LSLCTLADLDGILPRVEATLQQLGEQGYSGRTLSATAKPLTAFCRWCIGHGYLRDNPLKAFAKIDETPETERRALNDAEIAKLFSVAPAWRQLAYATAIVTGLRLSELRRLDRGDLDIAGNRLHLRWRQTKNKKPAVCYLPAKLVAQLVAFADSGTPGRLYQKACTRRALPDSPLLFVPSHLLRLFDKDLARAEIAKANDSGRLDFHGLRVACITLAGEAGGTVRELQTLARHSTPGLTMNVYAKARDGRMGELAERIGQNVPVFGLESATGVQSTASTSGLDACKSLPEQALSLTQDEKGLCLHGTGPVCWVN